VSFPPADLLCPHPGACPVTPTLPLPALGTVAVDAGRVLYRSYDGLCGYADANPGFGDTRFAPFDADTGVRVPVMYLAATDTAALLETVFHNFDQTTTPRLLGEDELLGQLLAQVRTPVPLLLLDLRDAALDAAGLHRSGLVSTPSEHYPCTRRLALQAHTGDRALPPVSGLMWHSRQQELAPGSDLDDLEVVVLFCDRVPHGRGSWTLAAPGINALYEGTGRTRVDEIAETLDVTIVT
jgi:hypothetical protein